MDVGDKFGVQNRVLVTYPNILVTEIPYLLK